MITEEDAEFWIDNSGNTTVGFAMLTSIKDILGETEFIIWRRAAWGTLKSAAAIARPDVQAALALVLLTR